MTRRYFRKKSRKKVHAVNADGQIVSPKDKNSPKATQDGKPQDGASKLDDKKNTKGNGSGSQCTPVLQMATIAEGKAEILDHRIRPYKIVTIMADVTDEKNHEVDEKQGEMDSDQLHIGEIDQLVDGKSTKFNRLYDGEEISVASDWIVHSTDFSLRPSTAQASKVNSFLS
jgi:hypothetical protein